MSAGQYAKWLPNLTVDICADCNNGWMSVLETQAKNILEPFFRTKRPIRLTTDELTVLTVWATKSWMAYSLAGPEQRNPFTVSKYSQIAQRQTPLDRSMVWIMHSQDEGAHVGIGISPSLLTPGPPLDGLAVPDNCGFTYLAADTLVMFLFLLPPDAPDGMAEAVFTPPVVTNRTVRRIWPSPRRQFFPLGELPHGALGALRRYPEQAWENLGLPTLGLNDTTLRKSCSSSSTARVRLPLGRSGRGGFSREPTNWSICLSLGESDPAQASLRCLSDAVRPLTPMT
jgi:hypothetical protein